MALQIDQELVYPNNLTFSTPEEQESYIRKWLEERLDFKADKSIYNGPVIGGRGRRGVAVADLDRFEDGGRDATMKKTNLMKKMKKKKSKTMRCGRRCDAFFCA
ncbi:hypothetical protein Syun_012455 [Stephania yunnanensis]|uniref:Uncharacterized protein n=1 Tax=Stephania yunnanensis TaxID=152371 RepID=A0AAP0K1P8_9MAGN